MTTSNWRPPKPSAYVPFFRRFTDERARELRETRELYDEVRTEHRASRWASEEARFDLLNQVFERLDPGLLPESLPVCRAIYRTIDELLLLEKTIFDFPEITWDIAVLSLKEQVELREFLRAKQHFLANEEKVIAYLTTALVNLFDGLGGCLSHLSASEGMFTVPLITFIREPADTLDKTIGTLTDEILTDVGLFTDIAKTFYENLCRAHGIVPYTETRKVIRPVGDWELPPLELLDTFFRGTPLREFFLAPVPLALDRETRFSHMHVVGGTGAGKTTFLQHLILSDLSSEDPPALVVVDSQGDLISKLSRLGLFDPLGGELADRFILITPKDIDYPPAINIFDINRERVGRYDAATREQVVAGVIETFDYLFSGLIGADLTAKQAVFFRFVARLMLALPEALGRNATILDMIELMDNPSPYLAAIQTLPPIPRQFFERDFPSKTFAQTKEQIRYRLNAILENPTLARLFTAETTRIDLFEELNRGSIIFVDTAKDFLKGGSSHFGRIFISLVLQAALERAALPERERRPAFLIVDEAADYFDSNIDDLLIQARKYRLGCLFSHQFLEQATPSLRASLAANTAIKMASGVSMSDARALAPDLRTTPEFILSQPKLHFACHIRNVTPQAVSVAIPYGVLDEQPLLTSEQHRQLRDLNRARVSAPPQLTHAKTLRHSGLAVSDFVQWTSDGVEQFETPRRIVGFSADGRFAFVEGSATGLPVEELTRVDRPGGAGTKAAKPGRVDPDAPGTDAAEAW